MSKRSKIDPEQAFSDSNVREGMKMSFDNTLNPPFIGCTENDMLAFIGDQMIIGVQKIKNLEAVSPKKKNRVPIHQHPSY